MIKPMLILIATFVAAPALAQMAAPAAAPTAAPTMPMCSAKVKDGCMQSPAAEKRAMSAAQADKRDAAHGGTWAPDAAKATPPAPTRRKGTDT